MLPDDDKRYAIETCRSSESVLKKMIWNKWHTISAFVGCVIISESYSSSFRFISPSIRKSSWNILEIKNIRKHLFACGLFDWCSENPRKFMQIRMYVTYISN